jgi:hypothetical protein
MQGQAMQGQAMQARHRSASNSTHRRPKLNSRSPTLPMIAKTFGIAKTFRSPSANFLRPAKSIRDHRDKLGCPM